MCFILLVTPCAGSSTARFALFRNEPVFQLFHQLGHGCVSKVVKPKPAEPKRTVMSKVVRNLVCLFPHVIERGILVVYSVVFLL